MIFFRALRFFAILFIVGITLVWFMGWQFSDIGRGLLETGKNYPTGYRSSICFLFNFLGMVFAGIVFLFILKENRTLSFVSLVLLAFIANFSQIYTVSYSADFFHVDPEESFLRYRVFEKRWEYFLNTFGTNGHTLGLLFSYMVWLPLMVALKRISTNTEQKTITVLGVLFGGDCGKKAFTLCEKAYCYFRYLIKTLMVYVFIIAFPGVVFRAGLIPQEILLKAYLIAVEAQYLFLLLGHLCAGLVLGKMLRKGNAFFIGGCSALLTAIAYFFTWMGDFPISALATYFFITYLSAKLMASEKHEIPRALGAGSFITPKKD
jgi:hypothetical protein